MSSNLLFLIRGNSKCMLDAGVCVVCVFYYLSVSIWSFVSSQRQISTSVDSKLLISCVGVWWCECLDVWMCALLFLPSAIESLSLWKQIRLRIKIDADMSAYCSGTPCLSSLSLFLDSTQLPACRQLQSCCDTGWRKTVLATFWSHVLVSARYQPRMTQGNYI